MKKLLSALLAAALLLLSGCGAPSAKLHQPGENGYIYTPADPIYVDGLTTDTYFAYAYDTDVFAAIEGAKERIYPASITKLLTALYAIYCLDDLSVEITPGDELELVKAGSSIAYIKSHHTLTAEMLIQGMLIPSGNDAAYALAAGVKELQNSSMDGAEAADEFSRSLNDFGKLLGLCSSSFTVPDGFAGREHYSSLEDMAIVAKQAFTDETIVKYCSMAKADVTYASGHTNTWINTNLLIDPDSEYYDERVICGKTGSLDGYYNVVFLAEIKGTRYAIGVFGSTGENARFADAIRIMDVIEINDRTAA